MSLIDDIRKALQGEKKSEFIDQILKEEAFYDALHKAGLTVTAADPTERGRLQPFGVLSKVQKIDLVDLITEITTIKNIENVDLIDLITRIALIDNITNVGTLNLLNTVNLIKSISSIDSITNIANIASLDLIDRITLIDSITNIGKIGEITSIPEFLLPNYIRNPSFDAGDFRGWDTVQGATITTDAWVGTYACKIAQGGWIAQYFKPIAVDAIELLAVFLKSAVSADQHLLIEYVYSDDSMSNENILLTNVYVSHTLTPTAGKYLVGIHFNNMYALGDKYVDEIMLLVKEKGIVEAKQATRTNLKAQTEREDLDIYAFDHTNSSGAEDYTNLLTHVNGKKIKVYDVCYESTQTNVLVYLLFKNGAQNSRIFAPSFGKCVQSYNHPKLPYDDSYDLKLYTANNCRVFGSIGYKSE